MDAHNPHGIRIFILNVGFSIVDIIFFHLLHVPDKMEQTEIAGLFEILRPGKQHFHIGPALFPAGQGGYGIQIPRFLKELLYQLMNGHISHIPPEPLQHAAEAPRLLTKLFPASFFRIRGQACKKPSALPFHFRLHTGNVLVGKACCV